MVPEDNGNNGNGSSILDPTNGYQDPPFYDEINERLLLIGVEPDEFTSETPEEKKQRFRQAVSGLDHVVLDGTSNSYLLYSHNYPLLARECAQEYGRTPICLEEDVDHFELLERLGFQGELAGTYLVAAALPNIWGYIQTEGFPLTDIINTFLLNLEMRFPSLPFFPEDVETHLATLHTLSLSHPTLLNNVVELSKDFFAYFALAREAHILLPKFNELRGSLEGKVGLITDAVHFATLGQALRFSKPYNLDSWPEYLEKLGEPYKATSVIILTTAPEP